MYRFVEQEKFEGKTIMAGGVTRISLRAMKHIPKVGVPTLVRGYSYRDKYGMIRTAVKVHGTLGTVRFGGFAWGYCGEGPRGLQELFDALGVIRDAGTIAPWCGWDAKRLGTQWKIKLS